LPLTPETLKTLASSLTHLRGDLLVEEVLSAIVSLGEVPFAWKDVKAICREVLGDGEALRDAEKAFDRRVSKVDRGLYVLRGSAPRLASRPATAPQALRTRLSNPEGISWNPALVEPNPERESWYGEDAGLRNLAIQSTKCFESWSDSEPSCRACPLARWCQEASLSKMEELARTLDAENELFLEDSDEVQTLEAEVQEAEVQTLEAQTPQTATQILESFFPEAQTPDSPEGILSALKARGLEASKIPLPFGGVCSGCGAVVFAGSDLIHIRSKGVYHPACAQAL